MWVLQAGAPRVRLAFQPRQLKPAGRRGLEAQVSVFDIGVRAGFPFPRQRRPALYTTGSTDTCASKPLLPAGFWTKVASRSAEVRTPPRVSFFPAFSHISSPLRGHVCVYE